MRVGGVDVRDYDMDTLRNQVAVVLQRNVLFSGTIKDNLRWGDENATDEELIEACKLAQADEFIQTFPDGYDTYIEQGGSNVSGGQKQRLCIARALLKKPKILILDDSTSAVDTKTDKLIRAGFKSFIPETTKIIIAQRTGSVEDADRIIVMDNGCISAVGTHEELLKTSDIYREVYLTQNKASHDEALAGQEVTDPVSGIGEPVEDRAANVSSDDIAAAREHVTVVPAEHTRKREPEGPFKSASSKMANTALRGESMEGGDLNG